MNRILVVCIPVLLVSTSLFAEGVYFEGGIGFGKPVTSVDGEDLSDYLGGSGVDEVGAYLGLKLGYGPIPGSSVYIAGVLEGIGHRFDDGSNYIQFNSYLLGPSVIVYPASLLQLSGSVGYSWVYNDTDIAGVSFYDSDSGYAFDVSAALDLGKGNHGVLLGAKYFRAINTLEVSGAEETSSLFGFFIKYAFRHKPDTGSDW